MAKRPKARQFVHLHSAGRYTWCRRAWHKRRKGRWYNCLRIERFWSRDKITCPDCIAEYAAERLLRLDV